MQTYFSALRPIKSVRIIRDKITHISKRFGFVEFYSVEAAKSVMDYLKQNNAMSETNQILMGNTLVHIAYARKSQQQQLQQMNQKEKTAEEEEALQIAQWNSTFEGNLSGYQYDSQSGYYYNSNLNYYYDPNTGYFYDCSRNVWMYFDSHSNQYFTVEQIQQQQTEKNKSDEKIIDKSFVPNPVYQQAIKAVEDHEKYIQAKLLQSSSMNNASHKKRKRSDKSSTVTEVKVDEATAAPSYEEDEENPLDESNIGNKLLRKMGFQSGTGLGKNANGITAPIQAVQKENKAGLGYSYYNEEPKSKKNKL